jgi:hypothetical protein
MEVRKIIALYNVCSADNEICFKAQEIFLIS